MQDIDDEEEETLSLCDLPMYGNAAADSHEEQSFSSSSSEVQDNYFEFFSSATSTASANQNNNYIIFCGKLIPYKQSQKPRKRRLFRWMSKLFNKPKTSAASNKFGFPVRRVSILRSPSTKSRWWYYLFMFGIARFPTEMDLCQMKIRQSRRRPSSMLFPSDEDGGSGGGQKLGVGSRNRSAGKGLWGLIRALSCREGVV